MNATDKKAVEQAKAAQNGSASKQKRTTRSTENAEQGLNNVQAKLNDAREKVRQSTKNYIFGGGISDALEDIANGDFGDLGNEIFDALDEFIGGIDSGRLALETRETEPKNAARIARIARLRELLVKLRQLNSNQKQVDKLPVNAIFLLSHKSTASAQEAEMIEWLKSILQHCELLPMYGSTAVLMTGIC